MLIPGSGSRFHFVRVPSRSGPAREHQQRQAGRNVEDQQQEEDARITMWFSRRTRKLSHRPRRPLLLVERLEKRVLLSGSPQPVSVPQNQYPALPGLSAPVIAGINQGPYDPQQQEDAERRTDRVERHLPAV